MVFFTPFVFFKQCQFYSIASSVLFTKIRNYGMREKKDFLHIWLLQCITLYQRRQKTTSLDIIEFLNTHVCINNPHWQSIGIIIFLCKYYIVISDTLTDSFLDVFFLLLAVILSELQEKPRRKVCVTKKITQKNLCEGHHFFNCTPSVLYVIFCCLLHLFSPLPKSST